MPALAPSPPISLNTSESGLCSPNRLELAFRRSASVTRLEVVRQDPPWRVIRAFQNARSQAVVHLHNVSGGILSGDLLHLSMHAGPGAQVQVTSVGATRIYRHRTTRSTATLSTSIRVDEGALLEYLPDAAIPFAGSRFRQSTTISLARNAGLIWWDTLAAGRIAGGEQFRFDSYRSESCIRFADRPLALERYVLEPSLQDLRSTARWGPFRYAATLYVCHTGVAPARWSEVECSLADMAFARSSALERWGVSTLIAGGLSVRGLAMESHQITGGLHAFWDVAKLAVWGESALAPRKIN